MALFLVFPFFSSAQTLTGLWTGALRNDNATTRMEQSFEIALTEYRGKVFGYSRSEFIVDDTLYYILKRVKGNIDGDICEVIDDEIISYNFRDKIDKGVKVSSTFKRNRQDSTWYLAGTWKTNATKKYYSVTGKLNLAEEKDMAASKIFPHLEELNLADHIAFYKERKEGAPIAKLARPEKVKNEYYSKLGMENPGTVVTLTPPGLQRVEAKQPVYTAKEQSTSAINKPVNTEINTSVETINANDEQLWISTIKKPNDEIHKPDLNAISSENVSVTPTTIAKAASIAGRKSEFSQMVSFKSDSLTLALYDNGEIDGDTVSIYMNGEVILSKQGLKSSAIKKTIYITPGNEEFTLVLFAENLGKYPPNTGLLVVRDGVDIYNLRFSSDFQKNAGIVFRRKK